MADVKIGKIVNANFYIDGGSYLGAVQEMDLPDIVQKMADHVALGMIGSFKFTSGVEAMESRVLWNPNKEALKVMGDPNTVHNFQIRANHEEWTAAGKIQTPYVAYLRGQFTKLPGGSFKQHENVELESMINVHFFKLEMNGEEIIQFDTFANIYKVNGVDIAATYRANIGQ